MPGSESVPRSMGSSLIGSGCVGGLKFCLAQEWVENISCLVLGAAIVWPVAAKNWGISSLASNSVYALCSVAGLFWLCRGIKFHLIKVGSD